MSFGMPGSSALRLIAPTLTTTGPRRTPPPTPGGTRPANRATKAVAIALGAATAVVHNGLELRWMLRRRQDDRAVPPQPLAAEQRSTRIVLAAPLLGELAAAGLLRYAPAHRLTGNRVANTLAALPGVWAGLALRHWAVATLGEHHRPTVDVRPGQPVIRTGPYRYVRHPSYAGGLLAVVSAGLILDHPPAWIALTGATAAALVYRIRAEDAVLVNALGAAYADYAADTARLIPGVW